MKNYQEIIKETLRGYWERDDEIYVTDSFIEEGKTCQLCGYNPIKYNYVLENSRTKETLIVGSNCVHNFKQAIESLGEEVKIKSANMQAVRLINKRHPGTVEFVENDENNLVDSSEEYPFYCSEIDEIESLSVDDLAPEGMGSEEFDWDSFDYEPTER
ncbi:MAG: hypothetical protein KKD99_03060 [Proteobacteria bacterium]|nr:hypothetical protein [Pseudomonadota bacterium]MBU4447542.1 hypothetical protein [Pseudomonadota bacterium]